MSQVRCCDKQADIEGLTHNAVVYTCSRCRTRFKLPFRWVEEDVDAVVENYAQGCRNED